MTVSLLWLCQVGIAPSLVEVRIKALNVGENRRKFMLLTAVARGYLGRMRVRDHIFNLTYLKVKSYIYILY